MSEPTRKDWRRRWRSLKRYLRREQRAYAKLRDASESGSQMRLEYHRAERELNYVLVEMKLQEEPRP